MRQPIAFDKRVLKIPYLLFAGWLAAAVWQQNWWLLLGIPLIYLGWAFSAPNLNLVDGCLPQISLLVSALLSLIYSSWTFLQIGFAIWISWIVCSIELAWRCEPVRPSSAPTERSDSAEPHQPEKS